MHAHDTESAHLCTRIPRDLYDLAMERPQVVAHRGASHENAEHTLRAYLRALDAGADAVECDVRLTADGHLVCLHDRDLRRTATRRGIVSRMSLAELSELDFSLWKNPWADLDDETQEEPGGPELGTVLTLWRLLEVLADHDRRVEIAIETKHPTRYGGLVERRLAAMLRRFGWDRAGSPVRVMSFSYTGLRRMARYAPELPLVMLLEHRGAWPRLAPVIGEGWGLGPGIELLSKSPRLAERLVATGRDLHVWTVNTPEHLQQCLEWGAKAVITDRPRLMLDVLDERLA